MDHLNPANVDHELLGSLLERYGSKAGTNPASRPAARRQEDPATLDEWAPCGIERTEDIRDLFVRSFFFGCEADDPLTATCIQREAQPVRCPAPGHVRLRLSHWDVPDMSEVLEEAFEMVEHGWITDDDFRDFMFTNPVNFFTRTNPVFFDGTAVEADVDKFLAGSGA